MIAHLHGILQTKNTEDVIIDIHGVGYLVSVPLSTFYELPDPGEKVKLHIFTHVREDCLQLFGFWTIEEKRTFELLLRVSKIGPKLARNVLSHISTKEFTTALLESDIQRLNSIPGIGEKTARRLVLELKDKIPATMKVHASQPNQGINIPVSPQAGTIQADAIYALVGLGYNRLQAERTVNQILRKQTLLDVGDFTIEELIKKALHQLAQ